MKHNPALQESPRRSRAPLIPSHENASILAWLESTGRLRDRDDKELDFLERDEEIADMLVGEDTTYEEEGEEELDD
ncbi:MAG: hypothetical protein Fur0042_30610 [Cyanophyceae cyanobacterium]